MIPETGIIMNNEMNGRPLPNASYYIWGWLTHIALDFSIPGSSNAFGYIPSPSNYIRPGKRPLSSITPTIVTHPDGKLFFITGATGGSQIVTTTIQNVIHAVDEGLSAAETLARPRLHDQLVPNQGLFHIQVVVCWFLHFWNLYPVDIMCIHF